MAVGKTWSPFHLGRLTSLVVCSFSVSSGRSPAFDPQPYTTSPLHDQSRCLLELIQREDGQWHRAQRLLSLMFIGSKKQQHLKQQTTKNIFWRFLLFHDCFREGSCFCVCFWISSGHGAGVVFSLYSMSQGLQAHQTYLSSNVSNEGALRSA